MKKFVVLFAAVAFAAGLTSCSKDYTCTCSYNNGVSDTTSVSMFVDVKKADAEDACDAAQAAFVIIDANANCSLD